jgi:hypothetical protein
MAENTRRSAAARRAAHALVHSLGATRIHLQMPALPIADDDGEELGLRSPEFQLQPFAPAAVRRIGEKTEVLLPAEVVEITLGVQGDGAVKAAFTAGSCIQIGDELFVLSSIESMTTGGSECLFRLLLQQPATEVV